MLPDPIYQNYIFLHHSQYLLQYSVKLTAIHWWITDLLFFRFQLLIPVLQYKICRYILLIIDSHRLIVNIKVECG